LASLGAGQPTVDIAPKEKQGTDVIIGPTLGMELPVFNRNQGGIARAELEHRQSLMQLDGLNRQVAQEIRRAHARARVAWDNVRFYRDQVLPLREASLDLSRTAYQAGRTTLLSVLQAERSLLAARAGYAESLGASAVAVVELEKAVGQPMPAILTAASQPADRVSATEK
jgi:cobalt-zinc-cadmium efflux system outer membrane protein